MESLFIPRSTCYRENQAAFGFDEPQHEVLTRDSHYLRDLKGLHQQLDLQLIGKTRLLQPPINGDPQRAVADSSAYPARPPALEAVHVAG